MMATTTSGMAISQRNPMMMYIPPAAFFCPDLGLWKKLAPLKKPLERKKEKNYD